MITISVGSTPFSLVLLALRLFLGLMIFTHGYRKFFGGGRLAGTAKWFESIGVRYGRLNALMAASTEVGVGVLLVFGLLTTLAAAGLMSLMVVAIATVHRKNGFFVFNKGEGVEYTLGVAVTTLVPGTFGAGRFSLDHLWNVFAWSASAHLVVTLVVGLGAAGAQLLAFYRPSRAV